MFTHTHTHTHKHTRSHALKWICRCKLCVTIPPSRPHIRSSSSNNSLLYGRWSTSGSEGGNAHFFPLQEYDRGGRRYEQTLGVNSEQKESIQHYISDGIYGLTLAWITSENSTKQLECRHLLTRSSSLDPISSATVSGVDRISPSPSPTACQLLCPTNSLLASRYLFRPRRDFKSKNPLPGFAPKQTKESFAWRATYIVLHVFLFVNIYKMKFNHFNRIIAVSAYG